MRRQMKTIADVKSDGNKLNAEHFCVDNITRINRLKHNDLITRVSYSQEGKVDCLAAAGSNGNILRRKAYPEMAVIRAPCFNNFRKS
ncbi:MAG: hypothetical protein UY52_C0013G0028 [Parcubacteria group bacterium GW2011_GWC2_49_9]|nr:MAG: hypothetical protein UY52_C0013G0028 [Parcubacteria group bacterium GW2011_GWC2_49_9]